MSKDPRMPMMKNSEESMVMFWASCGDDGGYKIATLE